MERTVKLDKGQILIWQKMKHLLVEPYNFVCGVCGLRFNTQPAECICGNDCEFEPITER